MLARWALAPASLLLCSVAALADVSHALLEIHERIFLEQDGRNVLGSELIHQPAAVASLYEQSGFQPIWEDPAEIDQVLAMLAAADAEGLNPADYHYQRLLELKAEYQEPWTRPY